MGVDPLGGAGVHYWARIAEHLPASISRWSTTQVDPTFRFMTLDWDGQHPHGSLLALCHAAADRAQGQIRHRLRLRHRPRSPRHRHAERRPDAAQPLPCRLRSIICSGNRPRLARGCRGRQDRGQQRHDRPRRARGSAASCTRCRSASNGSSTAWSTASLGFGGEESAGASFLRRDGSVWTTDKDGIAPALLSAEITARTGRDPGDALPRSDARLRRAMTPTASTHRRRAEQKQKLAELSTAAGADHGTGRRADRSSPDSRARQRRADRRHQGHLGRRLVRRASVRHRRHLQDLCRELSRRATICETLLREAQAIVDTALAGWQAGHANQRAYVRCSQETGWSSV